LLRGVGIALQIPIIANQNFVSTDDIVSVTSLTLFKENVSAAVFVASSEAAFTSGMVSSLLENFPTLNPRMVIDVGVTQLRSVFDKPAELAAVLQAYQDGCKMSHLLSIGCGSAAAIVSLVGACYTGLKFMQLRLQSPQQSQDEGLITV
jgi:hypothetical protein